MTKQELCAHLTLLGFSRMDSVSFIRYQYDHMQGASTVPFNMMVIFMHSDGIILQYDFATPDPTRWDVETKIIPMAEAWQIAYEFCKEHPGD